MKETYLFIYLQSELAVRNYEISDILINYFSLQPLLTSLFQDAIISYLDDCNGFLPAFLASTFTPL